jgi:hypothetical protein
VSEIFSAQAAREQGKPQPHSGSASNHIGPNLEEKGPDKEGGHGERAYLPVEEDPHEETAPGPNDRWEKKDHSDTRGKEDGSDPKIPGKGIPYRLGDLSIP